jgi:hypothetical protein
VSATDKQTKTKATKPARKKAASANEATLQAWKKTYANRSEQATSETPDNGKQAARPKRQPKAAPQLSEKTKKLTLKAFRLAYEAHHGKNS